MFRLLLAIALGLVGAGIVHILILFMLPAYSVRDAWSRISAVTAPYETVRLGEKSASAEGLPAPDNPFLQAAACRFDLSEGAVHVQAEGRVPFWSLSIYNDKGNNVFSINDEATRGRLLDLVVSGRDGVQLQSPATGALEQAILIDSAPDEGIALVRVFVPDETWDGLAREFLGSFSCRPTRIRR